MRGNLERRVNAFLDVLDGMSLQSKASDLGVTRQRAQAIVSTVAKAIVANGDMGQVVTLREMRRDKRWARYARKLLNQ